MRRGLCTAARCSLLALTLAAAQMPVQAALVWNWGYDGAGVTASGTFTTNDAPNASGYFTILNITGQRNGVVITGLQDAGTSIPGNDPFPVDNLLGETGSLLSVNGFGFAMANGTYANPFYASFLPGYLEVFSVAPFDGGSGSEDSELEVSFRASILRTTVPEPAGSGLVALALAAIAFSRRALHRRTSVSRATKAWTEAKT